MLRSETVEAVLLMIALGAVVVDVDDYSPIIPLKTFYYSFSLHKIDEEVFKSTYHQKLGKMYE